MRTARQRTIAYNVAVTLLAGVWRPLAMERRLATLLGTSTRKSQRLLVAEVMERIGDGQSPAATVLATLVMAIPAFDRAIATVMRRSAPIRLVLRPPRFAPVPSPVIADVPALPTSGDVARWLSIPIEQLDWFSDARRQHCRTAIPDLQHYTYCFRARARKPPRLIEAPKPRLKTMQRKILRDIVGRVPAHPAAHGFVVGRSCRSGATLHTGAAVVVCLDLADFFLTTPVGRVLALFRSLGYPDGAARALAGLCLTATPASVLDRVPRTSRHTRAAMAGYGEPHLPQGAPTSPALANLVAWRLDVRLAGLARSFSATYSRYADDLTFSGDDGFAPMTGSLIAAVAAIVADEGYALNERKTRVMTRSRRQQVTGIVVNDRLNVARDSYDRLKAILHNCRRNGLEAENRDGHPDFRAHLEGRVGWVESLNAARGRRLRGLLEAIDGRAERDQGHPRG